MVIKGHGYSKSTFGANNIFGGFGGHPGPPSSFTGNGHIVSLKSVTDYDENMHLGDYVDS